MTTVFLHLHPAGAEAHAWLQDAQGLRDLGHGRLTELAASHAALPTVVFIPSTRCLLTPVSVSSAQLRQAGQALGWLLEDQSAVDVERLHIMACSAPTADQASLLAMDKKELLELRDRLSAQGWQLQALLPDLFLLPAPEAGHWQLAAWRERDMLALRTGPYGGAVLEADSLVPLLDAAVQEGPAPQALNVFSPELLPALAAWAQAKGMTLQPQTSFTAAAVLSVPQDWRQHAANFLQGNLSTRPALRLARHWRSAAIFVAAALALQLLASWVQTGYYRYQSHKTETAASTLYRQLFPDEQRIVNLRRQWQAHENQGDGPASLLPVLTRLAESLQGSGLSAQRIDFNNGVLLLDVEADALTELDRFHSRLQGMGFRSEIVSAHAQGSRIRGRLRLEEGI